MLCYAVQCKWNGCDWMKMIEAKPNQIYSLQHIQTSSVCVRLFSAHFMHTHVPQSRLEISTKKYLRWCEAAGRDVFECNSNVYWVFHLFTSSFLILGFTHFCWRINNKAKVSACLCVRLLNHRKPKLISPATAGIFAGIPQRCKWITSVVRELAC